MKNNVIKLDMFEVVCKCGHVGKSHYVKIHFPVLARSGKEAARIARDLPRVKHDHKDAILNVWKIDRNRFYELRENNDNDPYLRCTCIQDQNIIDISDRLLDEKEHNVRWSRKDDKYKDFYHENKIIRNPKRYMNHYQYNDIFA